MFFECFFYFCFVWRVRFEFDFGIRKIRAFGRIGASNAGNPHWRQVRKKKEKKGKVAATGIVDTTGVGQPNQAYAKDAVGKKERKKKEIWLHVLSGKKGASPDICQTIPLSLAYHSIHSALIV